MIKKIALALFLTMAVTSHGLGHVHFPAPPAYGHSHGLAPAHSHIHLNSQFPTHGPAHQHAGIFLPPVQKVKHNQPEDVLYTRYCKAICYLYVPIERTCGTNNRVYENACQAKCDRVNEDSTRLFFNEKCCCSNSSQKIDIGNIASLTATAVGFNALSTTSFCINATENASTHQATVFSIPSCLQDCLDIDSVNDLEFIVTNGVTYAEGCKAFEPA